MKAALPRTATLAWSPRNAAATPLLATGTASGALDDSFSNESALEIWNLPFTGAEAPVDPIVSVSAGARCV